MSRSHRLVFVCLLLFASACAQNTPPAVTSTSPDNSKPQQDSGEPPRILGIVPQFSVTSNQEARPLTAGEKFQLFRRTSFDPFNFGAAAFQAGLSQATDEFPGYGQGASGYAKRFGATFADQVSSNFFANFFYPVLLKEDPRYFRLGRGSVKRRILYALEQEFWTRRDSGGRGFAFENVLGAFTSGTLSNAYYPSSDRGVGLTVSRSMIAIGYGSAGGLISEFWPDIHRIVFENRKKRKQAAQTGD